MDTTSMDSTTYLNRYRLIPGENGAPVALQRGPGGVTYQAVDTETGTTVAVKLVPTYSFEPAELEQLKGEARAAKLVDHPNVARLYDFGIAGGDVVFVTEVLDGITLDTWVSEHGPLPAAAAVRVAVQVVGGLAAAAFHSVAHRSIQPATLAIVPGQTPDGEWPLVKVLNFGG
ncbi:MAG: protein kinase, partial [Chthoniobacterales bacterium]|nr:protein kinase [Chthoniobacterales bacterium]